MNLDSLLPAMRQGLVESVNLIPQGLNRYYVDTPFGFDDGDSFVILLENRGNRWRYTDEAHTLGHLSYFMDTTTLRRGPRSKELTSLLNHFQFEINRGEISLEVPEGAYGDALFTFVQGLTRISDLTFLQHEIVRSTFKDDLRAFLASKIPEPRRSFDWHHPSRDPKGRYPVDCYLNQSSRPLLVFGLANDAHVNDASITIREIRSWGIPFRSLGIFEDLEPIGKKSLGRFMDAVDKEFSALSGNEDEIEQYLAEALSI